MSWERRGFVPDGSCEGGRDDVVSLLRSESVTWLECGEGEYFGLISSSVLEVIMVENVDSVGAEDGAADARSKTF
jgi:hypothetical protein